MRAQFEKFPLKKKRLLLHIDVVIFERKKNQNGGWLIVYILSG